MELIENKEENLSNDEVVKEVNEGDKTPTSINLEPKKENSLTKEVKDFLKDLIIIVVVVLIIRTFFILPFQISGQSMYDSYYDKEFIKTDLEPKKIKPLDIHRNDVGACPFVVWD